jgi:Zn-dependent protease
MADNLLMKLLFVIPSILIAFVVHEICHAYAAFLFGDPTPKYQGRLKPDPRLHIDPVGAAVLLFSTLFAGFAVGWAKPVQVNPYNFRNPRTDMAWVAFAGPLSNFTMAALAGIPLKFGLLTPYTFPWTFLLYFVMVNIGLGLFNMLPFPPLDGSKVLYGILPSGIAYKLQALEMQYAQFLPFIFIFVIFSGITRILLNVPFSLLFRTFTGIG